jgi:hypothetical protein
MADGTRLQALARQLEPRTEISTQRRFLVEIDGVPGYWKQMSGVKRSAPVTTEFDGGAEFPEKLGGPPDFDNVTLTRGYRPIFAEHVRRFFRGAGSLRVTVHAHDLDANGDVIIGGANSRTYPLALVVSTTRPDVDWSSGAVGNWVVELALGREV